MIAITAAAFPCLFEAAESASYNSGCGAGHEYHLMPVGWDLDRAENALATLSVEDLHDISVGSESEVEQVTSRSEDLKYARELVCQFLKDGTWERLVSDYLDGLANLVFRIPVMYGVDQGDMNRLHLIAQHLRERAPK